MDEHKQQLAYYRLTADETAGTLVTTKDGLTTHDAGIRLAKHGPNALQVKHKESSLTTYLRQYKDLMVALLLISTVISFYLGDHRTAIVLFVLVLLNTSIGFVQEFKAERIMESLERLVVPEAKVLRDHKLEMIASTSVVPGDVAYIEEGDSVPADLRLIDESELSTNDFALTGESNPSRKFTHAIQGPVELGDRHNIAFMGTTVATGHAYGIVIGTGMQSELGRIASLSQDTHQDKSPLQKEMNNIATRVTQGTVVLCIIMLPIAIKSGLGFKDALLFAIGIASSLIPQGLPAEINTGLAQAANKLAKAKALVKKLSAVETLGATNIICTDKTGTLTENQMTVESVLVGGKEYHITGNGYEANGDVCLKDKPVAKDTLDRLELFFTTAAMASNAHVNPPDQDHAVWYVVGDPTEGALITLARKAGIDPAVLDTAYPELKEFAFDSVRKRMSSVRRYGIHDQIYVFVKGAPESVLACCSSIWDGHGSRPLHKDDTGKLLAVNETKAATAMRNLGIAYKILPGKPDVKRLKMEDAESGLTWLGMVSMIDPLRCRSPRGHDRRPRRPHKSVHSNR
jgi:Ca2+-transporting ATPase